MCLVVRTFLGSGSFFSPVIYLVDCSLLSWEDPTSGSFWPSYCVPLVFSWVFFSEILDTWRENCDCTNNLSWRLPLSLVSGNTQLRQSSTEV